MVDSSSGYGIMNGDANYVELHRILGNLSYERDFVQDMTINPYGTREPIDDILLAMCGYTANAKNMLNFYNRHVQMKKTGRSAGFHYPSKADKDIAEMEIVKAALWFRDVKEIATSMACPNLHLLRDYLQNIDQLVFEAEEGPLHNLPEHLKLAPIRGDDSGPELA